MPHDNNDGGTLQTQPYSAGELSNAHRVALLEPNAKVLFRADDLRTALNVYVYELSAAICHLMEEVLWFFSRLKWEVRV